MYHFKIFLRHLAKNKLFTLITVFGFSVALLFVTLLSVYIDNELAIDDFHKNKDRIFRLETESGATDFPAPIAVQLKNEHPEIEEYTRVISDNGIIANTANQKFKFDFIGVDQGFLNMFSFPLTEGNKTDALQTKNGIVISKKLAVQLFKNNRALGKEVTINDNHSFIVTGVMENFPEDTHFQKPEALVNVKAMGSLWNAGNITENMGFGSFSIYFLAKKQTNLPAKAPQILAKFNKDFWIYTEGWASEVVFTPLKDLYFSKKKSHAVKSNSKSLVIVMSLIVLLILVLAIINYINLTIAQASFRSKEIAVKKLLGSTKKRLILIFSLESVFLCLVALCIALILAKFTEPIFNQLLDTQLRLNNWFTIQNILLLIGAFSIIGLISGLLPSLFMTNFKPIEMVRGSFQRKTKGTFTKALITFQYTVTISLIICTVIVAKQTDFLRNHDLGFEKDLILWMDYAGGYEQQTTIRNAIKQITGVEEVSIVTDSPLSGGSNISFEKNTKPLSFQEFRVDEYFLKVFGIEKQEENVAWDKDGLFVNEIGAKELEITSFPANIDVNGERFKIIGTVNDFNFNQLHNPIGPAFIRPSWKGLPPSQLFIKLKSSNGIASINRIKKTYDLLIDKAPYDYGFVDDSIHQWYTKEERTGKIIGYFTLLSLLVSALGILGMATFYMQQRRKEIGIRKVHGSSLSRDIAYLNKDFMKLILLAFIIAIPISYFSMLSWLEGFAYQTAISWWVFAFSGIVTLFIALMTVSWQSWKIAVTNPIDALQVE